MQCCAGICGGSARRAAEAAAAAEAAKAAAAAAAAAKRVEVVSPIVPIGEPAPTPATSLEELFSAHPGLKLGPPGAELPIAAVTEDFPRNTLRLLVLVPAPGAAPGSWEAPEADVEVRSATPMIRWAQANGCAVALFSAQALAADPSGAWDRVLRGSPAGSVTILLATGALPVVAAAMAPLHALLYNRFKTVCAPFEGHSSSQAAPWPPVWPKGVPKELVEHLTGSMVRTPDAWRGLRVCEVLRSLFELLAFRDDRFQRGEQRKYQGFQSMKENDMPGLKRLGLDERVQRMDRDRHDDELARLLKRNEKAEESSDGENEPGVD